MTRRAPTIRELDQRKRDREEPAGIDAADALMSVFGYYRRPRRDDEPEDATDKDYGDWT